MRMEETVSAGQPAGASTASGILPAQPLTLHYGIDGIVYGRRHPGRVSPGNCCVVVASPIWETYMINISDIEDRSRADRALYSADAGHGGNARPRTAAGRCRRHAEARTQPGHGVRSRRAAP